MKKRLTQPKNNKYYIRQVTGGLNGAVAGKPTIAGANVLCNCVGYANGRFNEIINDPNLTGTALKFKYQLVCNAENFIESAKKQGLKISSVPVLGGIMVWQKGNTLGGGDGAGHVAVVEEIFSDGTIMTSESGWNAWAFKTVKRSNANGRWSQASGYKFRGCIINPAVKNETTPAPANDGKLTIDGIGGPATVKAMQRFFSTTQDGVITGQKKANKKYYSALNAVKYGKGGSSCIRQLQRWVGTTQDGVLGEKTVRAWQKKIGITNPDGHFGSQSMKIWQTYLNTHDKADYPPAPAKNKVLAKAEELSWPKGTAATKYAFNGGGPTAAFKAAFDKVFPTHNKWGKGPKTGASCDVAAATCVRASGADPKMPRGYTEQIKYKSSTMTKLTYTNKAPASVAKPGDMICYTKNKSGSQRHVIIMGDGCIYEAQYQKTYFHRNGSLKKIQTKKPKVWIFRTK